MDSQFENNTIYKFIEIKYADPICALDLSNTQLILGTMMGRSIYFSIEDKHLHNITDIEREHITGAQLSKLDSKKFYLTIGDDKILSCKISNEGIPSYESERTYSTEAEHESKCESCFTFLYNEDLLQVFLNIPDKGEKNVKQCVTKVNFRTYNIEMKQKINGAFNMSNYSVPFDWNATHFIWVEYHEDKSRKINIYDFKEKKISEKKIDKSFGHVSHLKFFRGGRIFLVRNYNICEIYNYNFEVIGKFQHYGIEVIACDIFLENEIAHICTLDIDGNVNLYSFDQNKPDNESKIIFNLFELKGISQEEKDRQFFSMGYPYYIKMCLNYYAITTDYGCYLITR